jgi:phosphate starvation-inducible membrane PsiE
LDQKIQSIKVNNSDNSLQYNFSSLCAKINQACVIDGNYLLSDKFRQDASHLLYIPSGIYFDSLSGANGISSFIYSKHHQIANVTTPEVDYDEDEGEEEEEVEDSPKKPASLTEIVSYVPIFRLRYSLNVSNKEMLHLSMDWEREVLNHLNEKFQSTLINLSVSTSSAVADVVSKQAHDEGPYMAIMLLVFFIFVCFFISIQGNFHTSVGYLPLCGMISLALSSGATFGFLAVIRIQIIEPMALLVFVVASKFEKNRFRLFVFLKF